VQERAVSSRAINGTLMLVLIVIFESTSGNAWQGNHL
jgi:hypothetical protein